MTRLAAHISALEDGLRSTEPVGRRLDFLIQEILRETNTIGSKAGDLVLTQTVVEMKTLIEKSANKSRILSEVREMSYEMIPVGHGNFAARARLIAVVTSDSAPAKAADTRRARSFSLIDATGGRKTQSVLVMDSDHVVISAISRNYFSWVKEIRRARTMSNAQKVSKMRGLLVVLSVSVRRW